MELRSGYKQTDVGEIPCGWEVVPLGSLMRFQNGANADKKAYGYGVPFVNVLEVITVSHLKVRDIPGRVRLSSSAIENFLVRRGDIVFNRTSETQAEVGLASVYVDDEPAVFGGFVIRGRPIDGRIDPRYAGYGLRAPHVRRQVVARGQGAIRSNIGQGELRHVLVPIPPLEEQRVIASALTDADALVESLEQLLAKKRLIKQGTMQNLLDGTRRLTGFVAPWDVRRFSELADPRSTRVDPRISGRQDFCVELEHIAAERGVLLGSISAGEGASLKTIFKSGDVLFGKLRAYLKKYWRADRAGVCSTEIWALVPNPSATVSEYLFQVVQTSSFIDAASQAYGTHMPRSDWNSVKNYELQLPSDLGEQIAIAAVLSSMDAEIVALEAKRSKVCQIKQGMMQNLLTGKIRLV